MINSEYVTIIACLIILIMTLILVIEEIRYNHLIKEQNKLLKEQVEYAKNNEHDVDDDE